MSKFIVQSTIYDFKTYDNYGRININRESAIEYGNKSDAIRNAVILYNKYSNDRLSCIICVYKSNEDETSFLSKDKYGHKLIPRKDIISILYTKDVIRNLNWCYGMYGDIHYF